MGKKVSGTKSDDAITVNASNVIVENGFETDRYEKTKYPITKSGKNSIFGNKGNDYIYVKSGKKNHIFGDDKKGKISGNDYIEVRKGNSNTIYGGKGKDTIAIKGGSKNTIYGGAGQDTITVSGGSKNIIYGGAGKDSFYFDNKKSTTTIKDYAAGQDTLLFYTDGLYPWKISSINFSGKNVTFKGGNTSITLTGVAKKEISLKEKRGSYAVSKTTIRLGWDFDYGTLNAAKFLPTVSKIDGRNAEFGVNITGNAKNNVIYAGKFGGTLNGGAGNDTLIGSTENDTFVYAKGGGNDTITNYKKTRYEDDRLIISGGSVSKVELANSNKDFVFTVGSGSVTVKDSAAKTIYVKDTRGSYDVSKTEISLGEDFKGTMDFAKYLSTIEIILGESSNNAMDIFGNVNDNKITASKGGGTIKGGAGDDELFGNVGKDYLYGGDGDDDIIGGKGDDYLYGEGGKDSIQGEDGNDWLYGGDGFDWLTGGKGDDKLYGGKGDDLLYGGKGADSFYIYEDGNNYLLGNDGQPDDNAVDTFYFNSGATGTNTIGDFQSGNNGDIINLSNDPNLYVFIQNHAIDNGALTLDLSNNGKIIIQGYSAGTDIKFYGSRDGSVNFANFKMSFS